MGCQARVKFSSTCFVMADERQTVVLEGIQITLLDRLAARVSIRSLALLHPALILPLFMRGGASPTHDSLVANPYLWRYMSRWSMEVDKQSPLRDENALFSQYFSPLSGFANSVTLRETRCRTLASI